MTVRIRLSGWLFRRIKAVGVDYAKELAATCMVSAYMVSVAISAFVVIALSYVGIPVYELGVLGVFLFVGLLLFVFGFLFSIALLPDPEDLEGGPR